MVMPLIDSEHDIVAIVESAPRGYSPSRSAPPLFSGFISLIKRVAIRNYTLRGLCKSISIPYHLMHKGNELETEAFVKFHNPDLIVIYSMSQLLKKSVFKIPRFGAINLHPAYLPEYRGPNPDFWHYYDMNLTPGVTVHYIDKGEDSGDIILQAKTNVALGVPSTERLNVLIGEVGLSILLESIELIESKKVCPKPQAKISPTIRARHLFEAEHKSIINWAEWPIERIWNILRGTESWLNAVKQPSCIYTGQRWSILGYEKCSMQSVKNLGGISKDNRGYFIECNDGYIRVNKTFDLRVFLRYIYLVLRKTVSLK